MGASWTPPEEVVEAQKRESRPKHWTRDAAVLLGWGTFLVLLAYGIITVIAVILVKTITPETEDAIFGGTYDEMTAEMTPEEVEYAAYLQDIVDRLASHWDDNPYELRVAIMHEPVPNAMAVPGGTILVTTGLLEMAESENELAFVLGHEIGHFAHRHQMKRIGRMLSFAIVASVFIDQGAVLLPAAARLVTRLADKSFSRQDERDSDSFGLELVYEEYGTVVGATDFFGDLPDIGSGTVGRIASFGATHPLSEDRIDAMHALATERGWPETGERIPLPDFDIRSPGTLERQ